MALARQPSHRQLRRCVGHRSVFLLECFYSLLQLVKGSAREHVSTEVIRDGKERGESPAKTSLISCPIPRHLAKHLEADKAQAQDETGLTE